MADARRPSARALGLAGALLAAACASEGAPPFSLPWWPAPRVAAPSPMYDAAGLAPPALTGPGCSRDGFSAGTGLSGAVNLLVGGFGTTCVFPTSAARAARPAEEIVVAVDNRGRAWTLQRQSAPMAAAEADAAADSVVRRGLGLPGAAVIPCLAPGLAPPAEPGDAEYTIRGWRTPDYTAIVSTYPGWPEGAGTRVVSVHVVRGYAPPCQVIRFGSPADGRS